MCTCGESYICKTQMLLSLLFVNFWVQLGQGLEHEGFDYPTEAVGNLSQTQYQMEPLEVTCSKSREDQMCDQRAVMNCGI